MLYGIIIIYWVVNNSGIQRTINFSVIKSIKIDSFNNFTDKLFEIIIFIPLGIMISEKIKETKLIVLMYIVVILCISLVKLIIIRNGFYLFNVLLNVVGLFWGKYLTRSKSCV